MRIYTRFINHSPRKHYPLLLAQSGKISQGKTTLSFIWHWAMLVNQGLKNTGLHCPPTLFLFKWAFSVQNETEMLYSLYSTVSIRTLSSKAFLKYNLISTKNSNFAISQLFFTTRMNLFKTCFLGKDRPGGKVGIFHGIYPYRVGHVSIVGILSVIPNNCCGVFWVLPSDEVLENYERIFIMFLICSAIS